MNPFHVDLTEKNGNLVNWSFETRENARKVAVWAIESGDYAKVLAYCHPNPNDPVPHIIVQFPDPENA